jgi:hypothetical protein
MKTRKFSAVLQFHSSVLLLALLAAFGTVQPLAAGGQGQAPAVAPAPAQAAPAQMAPQSASVCGNQPLCSETPDFAAVITDFRTSTSGNWKVIDVIVRFQNKISQPIILGYVNGSLEATDDQGNRYGMAGNGQGIRGMGVINGNQLDPKFVLHPGGTGDTRFELAWLPGGGVIQGSTFELYLTIREASPVQGGQYVLGGEFPFHYQGLANGVRGAISPAASGSGLAGGAAAAGVGSALAGAASGSSAPPNCVPAGAQNAASTISNAANSVGSQNQKAAAAASQISNAANTLSSLGSLFGRKRAAAATPTAQNTTGLPPCPPGSTGDASAVSTVASTLGGAVPQAAGGVSPVAAMASSATGAPASAVAPGVASIGNPCVGRQHCSNAGPFTAEVQFTPGNQRAAVALTLRNVTNQPIFLAYKATTSQLRDNLGHALSLQQGPSGYARASRLNPGQGMPLGFGFSGGQNPLGTSFTYGVVIDQLQVLQNGQVQVVREYPLSFPGLMAPGVAPAAKAAASPASPAVKKAGATTVPKK